MMITIRRIRRGEADLYKGVRLASLKDSPFAFTTTYASAAARSPESWREQADGTAEGPDRCTFFVFSDETPVGIAAMYRNAESKDEGEVLQVWVAPGFRGTGVARDLLDAIFRWCEENGVRRVLAGITQGNERALRFYRKCGFEVVDSTPRDPLAGILLARTLPGPEIG
jgi:GNAT superfamily N-acetyltransferase